MSGGGRIADIESGGHRLDNIESCSSPETFTYQINFNAVMIIHLASHFYSLDSVLFDPDPMHPLPSVGIPSEFNNGVVLI